METRVIGKTDDPRKRILALEAAARAICEAQGLDPAEAVMMLLTAAVHMQRTYSRSEITIAQSANTLAGCLGYAIVAADDFFQLRAAPAAQGGNDG